GQGVDAGAADGDRRQGLELLFVNPAKVGHDANLERTQRWVALVQRSLDAFFQVVSQGTIQFLGPKRAAGDDQEESGRWFGGHRPPLSRRAWRRGTGGPVRWRHPDASWAVS